MAEMMKGNEAIAEAAIRAGARFYAGYPITPSSEIMEYLSWRMNEVGGALFRLKANWPVLTWSSALLPVVCAH